MQISFKDIKDKTAILVDGKNLGIIYDMFFSDEKVEGFQIQKNVIFGICTNIFVLTKDIESINHDLLIATKLVSCINMTSFVKAQEILSNKVITKDGFLMGTVNDILFDSINFKITGYEISPSIWSYIRKRKIILSPEEIILKENKILS
ncbi:PRC-barrel domain-containing protein [Caldicellulosiruptor naganoensis]|uniref:PRC-barrel domain-containing protein n=1 Tax=Caldicellulosiruptor naganoensis TaxID=29324 RepID=A0ABY7BGA6_9FIRM|nr:PRC-barrel domain-containing protein [Caldicellulosiruptor naganoensis]WAM30636.1 PRC-barrel domain-containing protein [Caldicellulosiruptor naganoensis]